MIANVRTWPISEMAARLIEVRSLVHSGPDLLTLSSSRFDPTATLNLAAAGTYSHSEAVTIRSVVARTHRSSCAGLIG